MTRAPDLLVVGGGIVGLTVAREAKRRYPGHSVVLLEKEERCGLHASGRNSGVLHAGFYYGEDSFKARFCVRGNRSMTEYCLERGLPIRRCGKLVVASSDEELPGLERLRRRGERNGVELEVVDEKEAKEIDPAARTTRRALYSPRTSSVAPRAVVDRLVTEVEELGVEVRTDTAFTGRGGAEEVRTTDGSWAPGYLINAAGLHADRIAREYGFGQDVTVLPFKGLYLRGKADAPGPRVHVYPVPDLEMPFLGVHFTVAADGSVKIGPTATPALWREHYRGLRNFDFRELVEVMGIEILLLVRNDFNFRRLALDELRKYSRRTLVRRAGELVEGVPLGHFREWGRSGIRAQLYHRKERRLVMDFMLEGDHRALHVLNAVSPGFTCAFPFAGHVVDRMEEWRG